MWRPAEQGQELLGTVRFIQYGATANSFLLTSMGIVRPDSPEMLTSLRYLSEDCGLVMKITLRIPATLLLIWTANTAHKGVIAIVSLYNVTSIFWTRARLFSMK